MSESDVERVNIENGYTPLESIIVDGKIVRFVFDHPTKDTMVLEEDGFTTRKPTDKEWEKWKGEFFLREDENERRDSYGNLINPHHK